MRGWGLLYLKLFASAFAIVVVSTPLVKRLATLVGAIDRPSAIKIHHKPTPRLGGVAIFFGFALSLLFNGGMSPFQETLLIGSGLALIVGVLDDIFSVPATIKLIVLFTITVFLSFRGIEINIFPDLKLLGFLVTLLWIVGVTSAFNAIDHMDGLAGGLTFFACMAYIYVAIQNGQWQWGGLASALMGASLGFLVFNYPPASIFMGDAGSFFLGFTLATMSAMGAWSTNPFKSAVVQVLILGLPIFDLIYVIARRNVRGLTKSIRQVITFSAKDHFSHRLLDLGMSTRQALSFSYAVMISLAIGAISLRYVNKTEAILLAGQFFMIIVLIIILMEYGLDNRSRAKPPKADDF